METQQSTRWTGDAMPRLGLIVRSTVTDPDATTDARPLTGTVVGYAIHGDRGGISLDGRYEPTTMAPRVLVELDIGIMHEGVFISTIVMHPENLAPA